MRMSRNTLQKEIILNTVNKMRTHPTAEEIYLEITKDYPHISKATVYRNLGLLSQNGIITKVSVPGQVDCYDYRVDHHHHLKCESCQSIIDVEFINDNNILDNVKSKDNIMINSFVITFNGLCNNCLNKSIKEEN